MRRFILSTLALATLATPAIAQVYPGEIRDDRREVQREYRDLEEARQYGDRDDIREEREEFRDARRELRDDVRERQQDGVYGRDDRRYDDRRLDERRYDERRVTDGRYQGRRFQGATYYHPRGYGYRRYVVGGYLPRAYWGNRYNIARPGAYGLTGQWRGTQWIRVGGDALLIRVRNGSVVKVVRGIYY